MGSSATWGLLTATFTASFVEFVEALTIVLAMGMTRSWRSALWGTGLAVVALAAFTAVAGYALVTWLPRSALQLGSAPCSSSSGCSGCARRSCARRGSRRCTTRKRSSGSRRTPPGRPQRDALRAGLVLVRRLLQGRVPRRRRGGLHRDHLRAERAQRPARRGGAAAAGAVVLGAGASSIGRSRGCPRTRSSTAWG